MRINKNCFTGESCQLSKEEYENIFCIAKVNLIQQGEKIQNRFRKKIIPLTVGEKVNVFVLIFNPFFLFLFGFLF